MDAIGACTYFSQYRYLFFIIIYLYFKFTLPSFYCLDYQLSANRGCGYVEVTILLVERDQNLKLLVKQARSCAGGRGNIVLVSGEAGIGKTALLSEMQSHLQATHRVIWGGCDPLDTPRPLGPIHDMASDLGSTVMNLLTKEQQSAHLFAAVYDALLTSHNPSVVVIEDAHWADNATLDLLRYLGRRISFLKVALIISFRDDEINYRHPLAQVLGDLPQTSTSRIALEPLSPDGVRELANASGHDEGNLHDITAGNPFFVTELLAGVNKHDRIPASIRDAVNSRLNRLPDEERQFLENISVIPGAITPDFISLLFPVDGDRLARACAKRRLLTINVLGAYRFRHELARLSTLERVSDRDQQSLHATILKGFSQEDAVQNLDTYVHHAAGAKDHADVLEYAPRAAKRAAALGAHVEAVKHLSTALDFVDYTTPEQTAGLYESWAYEASLALKIDDDVINARHKAIDIWQNLGRQDKVGENLRALSRLHWYLGESSKATEYSDAAIEVLETLPPSAERAMAYSLRSQIHMLHDRMDESIKWGNKALDLAEEFNDVEVKVHALNNVGTAMAFRGDLKGRDMLEESLELSLKHGLHEDAARVYTNLSEYGVEFGNYKLAEKILADGIRFSINHDVTSFTQYLNGRSAQLRMSQGYLREAETIAKGVLGVGKQTLIMRLPATLVLSRSRLRLGEPDAPSLLQQALDNALATEELQYIVPARLALIEAAWLHDKPVDAIAHIEALASLGTSNIHPWSTGELAVWTRRLGMNLPQGFVLENIPIPYVHELDGNVSAASNVWDSIGSPYNAGIALMQVTGDGAASALSRSIKILESIEARSAVEKARRLADSLGLSEQMPNPKRGPYRAARKHPLGLTKREQEILTHMVNGATNRDISDILSRSQRTVEHHVSNILKKLGVENRMEAMLRVHNEPWLTPDAVIPNP